MKIVLRPIADEDNAFLRRVYASTREEELAITGWSEAEKKSFLDLQFNAQHSYYQQHFPSADYDVIMAAGKAVGRLYVDRRADEIRILDIALLTRHRRRGIGSELLRGILTEGADKGLPVSIHVEHNNPALRLYERLGFGRTGDTGIYYLMERPPGPVEG